MSTPPPSPEQPPPDEHPAAGWVALVPVKPPSRGKSRLLGLDDAARRELAASFALDTVTACLAAPGVEQVLVVTDDAGFAVSLSALGASCLPDGASGDLNDTLRQSAAEARRRWPDLRPFALCADLPSLQPAELAAALAAIGAGAAGAGAFVPDASGVGTTLYTAPHASFEPRYGGPSRQAHLDAGCVELTDAPRTLRHDVDDLVDLQAAVALGLGPHTTEVVAALRLF